MYTRIKESIRSRVHRGLDVIEKGALAAMRHAPLDSSRFGPPRGFVRTAENWTTVNKNSGGKLHVLKPDQDFRRTLPKILDDSVPWQFERSYGGVEGRALPGTILEVPDGRVCGTGTIIDAHDQMIGDVSRELILLNDQSQHSIFKRMMLPPVTDVPGTVGVSAVVGADVYWHWMVDLLPRLHLLDCYARDIASVDRIVISPIRNNFQIETLAALGIDRSTLIETNQDQFHIRADRVLAPCITPQVPARWMCNFLHEELGSRLGGSTINTPERLYVSRNDARSRRLLNEDAVMARLEPLGFRKVTMTGLRVADQAALFRNASVIITPHGSGLTNMVFSNPGTVVIELFQPAYTNSCYWAIADFLKIDYYAFIGLGKPVPPPPPGVDSRLWSYANSKPDDEYGDDLMVDIDRLMQLVQRAVVG